MGKKGWIYSVLAVGLIGLTGCSENTTKIDKLEDQISKLEKQLEAERKAKEEAIQKYEASKEVMKETEPVIVSVVDPATKQVIKTFEPLAMGWETNKDAYRAELKKWVKEIARGTDKTTGYDQRMIPDRIGANGQIIKGSPRIILEEEELIDKLLSSSEKGGIVVLPLYVTESGYKPEETQILDEEVVAKFTTQFNSSVTGRSKNIELSAEAINNVIIGAGDIFSFNTTVGPSDAAHGYQPAPEYLNGKLVEGIGGGICQTSSTLFNAVDQLGVKHVEWHHHSGSVGYVPKGRDATVSYGGLDYRFENTTGIPLLIKAIVKDGTLTVEIRTTKEHSTKI
ncbi:VanW family protein [Pseudoneobacillus sp. C159]